MAAAGPADGGGRFSVELMHAAAVLYYLEDATQAEIAERLDTSRATVSRLLSEARRQRIVTIQVADPPVRSSSDLAAAVAAELRLLSVHLASDTASLTPETGVGRALSEALRQGGLGAGDVVLVSSGRMLYAAAQGDLPALPGVLVVPTVGGLADPAPWYQTNEITRSFAAKVGGHPVFLYAPALPGAGARESLLADPSIGRVLELWGQARCAVIGVGAPTSTRRALPAFVPAVAGMLPGAVGDICSRFYDAAGAEVAFPGSERLIATSFEQLRAIPSTVAVALGAEKVGGLLAAARAGYYNRLVTDAATASLLVQAARRERPGA